MMPPDLAFQAGVIGMGSMLFAKLAVLRRFLGCSFLIVLQATEFLVSSLKRRLGFLLVALALPVHVVGVLARRVQAKRLPGDGFSAGLSCIVEGVVDYGAVDDLLLDMGHHLGQTPEGIGDLLELLDVRRPGLEHVIADDLVHGLVEAHPQRETERADKSLVRRRTARSAQFEQASANVAIGLLEHAFFAGNFGSLQQLLLEGGPFPRLFLAVDRLKVIPQRQLDVREEIAAQHIVLLAVLGGIDAHSHGDGLVGFRVAPDEGDIGVRVRPHPVIGHTAVLAEAIAPNRPCRLVLVSLGVQRHEPAVCAKHGDLDGIEERALSAAVCPEQPSDFGNADMLSFIQKELHQVDTFQIFHASSSSGCSGP